MAIEEIPNNAKIYKNGTIWTNNIGLEFKIIGKSSKYILKKEIELINTTR